MLRSRSHSDRAVEVGGAVKAVAQQPVSLLDLEDRIQGLRMLEKEVVKLRTGDVREFGESPISIGSIVGGKYLVGISVSMIHESEDVDVIVPCAGALLRAFRLELEHGSVRRNGRMRLKRSSEDQNTRIVGSERVCVIDPYSRRVGDSLIEGGIIVMNLEAE